MKVRVHLHTILQQTTSAGPVRELDVELPDDSTLSDLIQALNLEIDDEQVLCVVQGQISERTRMLSDNDVVHFIPAISGG